MIDDWTRVRELQDKVQDKVDVKIETVLAATEKAETKTEEVLTGMSGSPGADTIPVPFQLRAVIHHRRNG
jgi:hypothetical protein